MGMLSLTLVQWLLIEPETLERERKERLARRFRVDWIGIALVVLWLGCLEFVLDRGQREDWFQSHLIIAFAVVSAVSFVLFIPWELSREDPIVDLRLMRRLQFLISFVMMMMVGAVLFSTTQLLPQLMQEAFGYTATLSGLALMPGGFAMLVLMPIAGIATNQFQPKYLLAFGMGVIALAMWHLTSLPTDASFHFFEWARVLQMIGMPFLFVPITTAAYAGLPPEMTNQASSLVNVARNLGGSIGVSMAVTLLAQREQFHQVRLTEHLVPSSPLYQDTLARATSYFITAGSTLPDAKHRAMAWLGQQLQMQTALLSYIDVFYIFALCAALMVAVALILLRRIERHEHIPNAY